MKLFSTKQIAEIDALTIEKEPIVDIDLMERAASALAEWIIEHIPTEKKLIFFAGPGNNGGDAMAVARMVADTFSCELFLCVEKQLMGSSAINYQRLKEQGKVNICNINSASDIPDIDPYTVVVDGLFGSGLNRPLNGLPLQVVAAINKSEAFVVSIDMPSGLFGEDNSSNISGGIIRANHTLTFQFPKLSFLFAENEKYTGCWEVLPIGLHPEAISVTDSPFFMIDKTQIALKPRGKFTHKGTYGHALLIAGSRCKIGAAILASRACLRSGVGLVTSHVPNPAVPIIHMAVPEAICSADASDLMFTEFPHLKEFSSVGIGPGIGTKPNSQKAIYSLLQAKPEKIILDADALNILSMNKEWYKLLSPNSILTPHPKEFERLAGASPNSWERLQLQMKFSQTYKVIVVLKGAHTSISLPDGSVFFNNTGNAGMATAGSGDVLTGIITGLLAQQYSPAEAAIIGVHLHGLAGDLAVEVTGQEALVASNIIDYLGKAFINTRV